MPKRTDIKSILVIGSGPIVIGQACEFDYSGTQAIKALKEEGYRVTLINSNPATIMTDPEFADATYIEPLRAEFVEAIIRKEKPDAILPTMGGQTALNLAIELDEKGILAKYGVELIGASVEAIKTAEDRELFRRAMDEIGLESARSALVRSVDEAEAAAGQIGFPIVLRPSRTLGGTGGGIAKDLSALRKMVARAIGASPNGEVLLEESLLGWKEIELEVMRDLQDNVVIICGIENFDPMGVHTGDSITVAPIQTLTDKEYQVLRDAAVKVMRRIGVDTGGSNVQFALNPQNGRVVIIEMNPRVSRSSALASKATGFPIAKMAAKLAIGYSLDEIQNDITRETPACFEPSIDYVVVKIPRFNFEKFPLADSTLGTQMRSVGEVLSFGRTFGEALQKAVSSMEIGASGFDREGYGSQLGKRELLEQCARPSPDRIWFVAEALRKGHTVEDLYRTTSIDPWFLTEISRIVNFEEQLRGKSYSQITKEGWLNIKRAGFSDRRLAQLLSCSEQQVREARQKHGVRPSFLSVDTCAAEFEAHTPYLYSTYEQGVYEYPPSEKKKVIILGSGPNRIGQGIEFDYCCTHASLALRELGIEAIMINCNPETVSTDYDVSDRLYFEPLTLESVLEIVQLEQKSGELLGVIIQFGGQTPLKLSGPLSKLGVPVLGTCVDSIDIAEDRERFSSLIRQLGLKQPEFATARSLEQGLQAAEAIGYPLMVRPSFVLGGRAMRVVYSAQDVERYFRDSVQVSEDRPVLLDRFLPNAIELDVDAICDGREVVIAGVLEHTEPAGIHSGDSSCCIPPPTLSRSIVQEVQSQVRKIALALDVRGLINIQFAVTRSGEVYILEANPRASRTVPFISKSSGIPWAKVAVEVMTGREIRGCCNGRIAGYEPPSCDSTDLFAVKASVFPFSKFEGVDTLLGPEMKSTGEVMGVDITFAGAFARAQAAAGNLLPTSGAAFLSVMDHDKQECLELARQLSEFGFQLLATAGTAEFLAKHGVRVETVRKVREGSPHIVDLLGEGRVQLVINTPEGQETVLDSKSIRLVANEMKIPTYTTVAAASAAVKAIEIIKRPNLPIVRPAQSFGDLIAKSSQASKLASNPTEHDVTVKQGVQI